MYGTMFDLIVSDVMMPDTVLKTINNYVVFFLIVAFVVTCCMMLFVSTLTKSMGLVLTSENIAV